MFKGNDLGLQKNRRNLVVLALASTTGLLSCATPEPEKPIFIEAKDVKDVQGLIAEIKKAAGKRLPQQTSDDSFYRAFAQSFVDNAVEAAERYNIPVPDWVLSRISKRKVVVPVIIAPMVVFTIYGVQIQMAIATICNIVVYSIAVMAAFIWAVIKGLTGYTLGCVPEGTA